MTDIQNETREQKKARKCREAKERQAAHDALTPKQKMDKLNAMAYRAKTERARLRKQIGE